jgi:integration host factor subunit alpha
MTTTKIRIVKKMSNESKMTIQDASNLLDKFISIIKISSKKSSVKLPSFGTFSNNLSKLRVGRNPKTMEIFEIQPFQKTHFKPSNKIKALINL